jgi:hypothetical protein
LQTTRREQALFIDLSLSGRWSSLRTDGAAALTVAPSQSATDVHDNISDKQEQFVSHR